MLTAAGATHPPAYAPEEPWLPASEGIVDWGEEFHALMLGDRLRMTTFRAAIRDAVRPGDVVLDLGTGTGILAEWALDAGASRAYGLDVNADVLAAAVDRLGAAGHGSRFVPVHGMSYDLRLPEPVDLIISETLGNLVDNESCVPILADARDRLLRPGGRMLPARAQSYLVPVAATRAHASVAAGAVRGGDEAVPVETRLAASGPSGRWATYYDTVVPWSAHLAGPRLLRDYDFTAADSDAYDVALGFLATAPGTFTGFKGWFVADLSDTVTLDISGDDIAGGWASDSWKHCYLPVERAVEVRPGDRITVTVSRRPAVADGFGQRYRWAGAVRRGPDVLGRFDHRSGVPGEWAPLVPAAG